MTDHASLVLDIAEGFKVGKAVKHWKQRTTTWGELLERLSSPGTSKEQAGSYLLGILQPTPEVDHLKCKKQRCPALHRNKAAVVTRCAITLDVDALAAVGDPEGEQLLAALEALGVEAVAHETFSSEDGARRFRVVILTARRVLPSEYGTVARWLMRRLGWDGVRVSKGPWGAFDRASTFGWHLMYDSARPEGEPFDIHHFAGELLDVDQALFDAELVDGDEGDDSRVERERSEVDLDQPATPEEVAAAERLLDVAAHQVENADEGGRHYTGMKWLPLLYRWALGGCLDAEQVAERMEEAYAAAGAHDYWSHDLDSAWSYALADGPTRPEVSSAADVFEPLPDEPAVADEKLAALLDAVEAFLRRFIVFTEDYAYPVVALWVAHTYAYQCFESSPRLAVLSPDPSSGKSRVLEVLEVTTHHPLLAMSATQAALFRSIPAEPTILFDEIDAIFGPKAREHEDVRALLNSGHRRGAAALRCEGVGANITVERWETYAPAALAGLGWLPDTLMARSIVLKMKRRLPTEKVEPFRHRVQKAEAKLLRVGLTAWAERAARGLTKAWTTFPDGVEDRDADVWEAMLIIADCAGGSWPARARGAAEFFVKRRKEGGADSLGIKLLRDLRTVFTEQGVDKLTTTTLLHELCRMTESPWANLKGSELDANGLARQLKAYDVSSGSVREQILDINTGKFVETNAKGYKKADLHDAWERYLGADDPDEVAETPFEPLLGEEVDL